MDITRAFHPRKSEPESPDPMGPEADEQFTIRLPIPYFPKRKTPWIVQGVLCFRFFWEIVLWSFCHFSNSAFGPGTWALVYNLRFGFSWCRSLATHREHCRGKN